MIKECYLSSIPILFMKFFEHFEMIITFTEFKVVLNCRARRDVMSNMFVIDLRVNFEDC